MLAALESLLRVRVRAKTVNLGCLIRKAHYFLALRGGENFAVNVDRVALVLGFLGGDGRDGRGLLESWEDEPIIGERNGN